MYQNCCKKCGSISLHTEVKGNNTGLYCDDCGSWIKWLGKDELRAFEYSMREATKNERESVSEYIKSISKPTGVSFTDPLIADRLQNFLIFLDKTLYEEYEGAAPSKEDVIMKNSYCTALKKCRMAIENILSGKEFDAKN